MFLNHLVFPNRYNDQSQNSLHYILSQLLHLKDYQHRIHHLFFHLFCKDFLKRIKINLFISKEHCTNNSIFIHRICSCGEFFTFTLVHSRSYIQPRIHIRIVMCSVVISFYNSKHHNIIV